MADMQSDGSIPKWGRFECALVSAGEYGNPIQDVNLTVQFISPTGRDYTVDGFWDGGRTWRVRFMLDECGRWSYRTLCSNPADAGLHGQTGQFYCGLPLAGHAFQRHGPLRLSDNRLHLAHADGKPFLWLADTAWNGPLRATDAEWDAYLRERVRQRFTAVQWVATHWLAAPDGDEHGALAFTGKSRIRINPAFYRRLDRRLTAINEAGLLGAPVLLWAAEWRTPEINESNPGLSLPEDQAILLARYMIARWGAHYVLWILPGDGYYHNEKADRWRRIGRTLFGERPHAPVSLHPAGMHLFFDEFQHETWLDILGYQSGHGDDDVTWAWLVEGPPATEWKKPPARPFINLEPPYEDHISYQSGERHTDFSTRRATYWSLLVTPTAGVSYGGHGVWGWDDGTQPPVNHPRTGIPQHWSDALHLLGAEQFAHLAALFNQIAWWTLRPAPELLASQPGDNEKRRFIAAARSEAGELAVVYIPEDREVALRFDAIQPDLPAFWFNPRTGEQYPVTATPAGQMTLTTPAPGDWLLVIGHTHEESQA
jgi:hypothetical protein